MGTLFRPTLYALFTVSAILPPSAVGAGGPGGSIDVTSDYVLRGISQSAGRPALQGDAHWDFPGGWSTGAWASQVRLAPQTKSWELDGYLQWHGALSGDLDMEVAGTYYSYPADPRPLDYNYEELSLSLIWRDQVRISARWTPSLSLYSYADGLAAHHDVLTLEASWHRDLPSNLQLTTGLGFYYPPGLDYASYSYGDASLGWKYGHLQANLALIWVQDAVHRQYSPGPAGGPLAATLAWIF